MKRLFGSFVFAFVLMTLLGFAAPVNALESDQIHPDIRYALEAVPGGVVVSNDKVVWEELSMEMTLPSQRAVGTCTTGAYCAYSGANRSGAKLSFTSCGTVSTTALSAVGSIANARSSGSVEARNSANTVLATANAGASVNVFGAITNLRCVP